MVLFLKEIEWEELHAETLARVARENAIHITVYKEKRPYPAHEDMWRGYCTCGKDWQFWYFGATLGYGLEHIRRELVGS